MIIFYFIASLSIVVIGFKCILFVITKIWGKFTYKGFNALGFKYNSDEDVFYATRNAWQKQFGYSRIYDVASPLFNMILDVERVKFKYNNKNWLISFWKGQYAMCTGAEIGVYNTKDNCIKKNTLYMPVKDVEMLDMGYLLYDNDELLIDAESKHWWLAIFKLGYYAKPKNLTMIIKIKFPSGDMLNAFLKSFKKLKYKEKYYKVVDNTFWFIFKKPKTRKVWTRFFISDKIKSIINKNNVKIYNRYLSDFIDNDGDKLIHVSDMIPKFMQNKNDFLE